MDGLEVIFLPAWLVLGFVVAMLIGNVIFAPKDKPFDDEP